jgi:hypothetical protein
LDRDGNDHPRARPALGRTNSPAAQRAQKTGRAYPEVRMTKSNRFRHSSTNVDPFRQIPATHKKSKTTQKHTKTPIQYPYTTQSNSMQPHPMPLKIQPPPPKTTPNAGIHKRKMEYAPNFLSANIREK